MRAMRIALPYALIAAGIASAAMAAPVQAAERRYSVASFERLRVEGPFEVRVTTGGPATGMAATDERTLDRLTLTVEGTTLIVRLSNVKGWGERGSTAVRTAPVVTLTTPLLRSALAVAGARVHIGAGKSDRFDVAVNGAGSIAVTGLDADQVIATVIGTGAVTLSGAARETRLLLNGAGQIDSAALQTGDLTVRLEGTGEIRTAARYNASVTTSGLGRVTVAGKPRCRVRAISGGPVICEGVRQ